MADRAASATSIRAETGPVLKIKVTDFDLDTEIRFRRSITSDNDCVPCTVFESAGGLIRGMGFVDPSDTITARLLVSFGQTVAASDFDYAYVEICLDIVTESAASRFGYTFGTTVGSAKIFPMNISGQTNEAGMLQIHFEVHSQKGVVWSTGLT